MIKYSNLTFHIFENHDSHFKCIKDSLDVIHSSDIVFINTISQHVKSFTCIEHPCMILRIHNANRQFQPLRNLILTLNPKSIFRLIKFFIKEVLGNQYFMSIHQINKKVRYFAFPDLEMLEFSLKTYQQLHSGNILYLPLKMFSDNFFNQTKGSFKSEVKLSVVGRIDYETRDIPLLINVIKKISKEVLLRPVTINFIGSGYKMVMKKLMSKLTCIENNMIAFTYNLDNVSQLEMRNILVESDIIVSPLKIDCIVGVFKEKYGQTKVTGNFSDIAISPQPVFLPVGYLSSVDNEGRFHNLYKNEDQLANKLIKCINDNEFLIFLTQDAKNIAQERYGRKIISEQLSKIFMDV